MEKLIEELIINYGNLAVMFLILLENIFPPIPSEVILTLGGFLTAKLKLSFIGMIVSATIGSVLGAVILYKIGTYLNESVLRTFLKKHYKWFRVKEKDLDKTFSLLKKYGNYFIFFGRMIPVVRSLISIPAGMIKMNFKIFLVLTTFGTMIWNTILITLGMKLGENWGEVVNVVESYSGVIKLIAVIAVAMIVVLYVKRVREK